MPDPAGRNARTVRVKRRLLIDSLILEFVGKLKKRDRVFWDDFAGRQVKIMEVMWADEMT